MKEKKTEADNMEINNRNVYRMQPQFSTKWYEEM